MPRPHYLVFARGQADALLLFIADQGKWASKRSCVSSRRPLARQPHDVDQHLRESVAGHRAVLEARLDHIPLLPPKSAVARKQTVSKDRLKPSNLCGAAKGAAILDQNFFNIVGMTEKDDFPA